MHSKMVTVSVGFALLISVGSGATAQEIYSPNYVPGWNDAYIMRHKGPDRARQERPRVGKLSREQRMERYARMLAPEYNRRLKLHGKVSANRWLAAAAKKLGQRDAARVKRR